MVSSLPTVRGRGAVPSAPQPLSRAETEDLARCEGQILDGLDRMGTIGRDVIRLLAHIREKKLWRGEFKRFEDYARARFGKSARRLRQLLSAEGVMRDLEEGHIELPTSSAEPRTGPARVLPTTESQVRALVALPKDERKAAWERAKELAGPEKQPTAKDVRTAVDAGSQKWPKSKDGCYDEKEAEALDFTHPHATARILLLQISSCQWIWNCEWQFKTGSLDGRNGPLRAPKDWTTLAETREEALQLAAAEVKGKGLVIVNAQAGDVAKTQRAVAQKMIDWVHRFLGPQAKPKIETDQWVVVRPPLKGATSPSAMIPRYSGPSWGWSPNPQKGKPYTNWDKASAEAARHGDQVVALKSAIEVYRVGESEGSGRTTAILVREHERVRSSAGRPDDITEKLVDAKFRVIDAEVELKSAWAAFTAAGGRVWYHAEKAADHLACLKSLLSGGKAKST